MCLLGNISGPGVLLAFAFTLTSFNYWMVNSGDCSSTDGSSYCTSSRFDVWSPSKWVRSVSVVLFGCQDSVQGVDDGIHACRGTVRVERSCLQPCPGLGLPQTLLDSSSQTCRVKPRRLRQERARISQQSYVRPCSRSSWKVRSEQIATC